MAAAGKAPDPAGRGWSDWQEPTGSELKLSLTIFPYDAGFINPSDRAKEQGIPIRYPPYGQAKPGLQTQSHLTLKK